MRTLIIVIASMLIAMSEAAADMPTEEAKKLFERYVTLERAFDPTAADLYSDEAKIQNKRIYPDGSIRVSTLPASNYKQLLRQAMPLAKQRGDSSTYSDIKYANEGGRIRINATRFSNLKKYSSPLSLLVGPSPEGKWLIYEELSESKP